MGHFSRSLAVLVQLLIVTVSVNASRLSNNFNENDPGFFLEFQDLMAKYKPLNLGLGAPDFNPPKKLKKALINAAGSDNPQLHQYAPSRGHPRLLNAVGNLYSKLLNKTLNPNENVIITVGAIEALHASFQAHTDPGDEWIIFSPYFPAFDSLVKAAHGVPRYIPLIANKTTGNITSSDFKFNRDDLANAFNSRTKGILVNTPHNPTGKIFDREELEFIAELAKKWDSVVIFDEVYQFLNYCDKEHLRIATFPGMFERTISVGSGGKMFGATGYRIGWAYGPKDLISNINTVDANVVMSAPTPIQEALAVVIEEETEIYGESYSYIELFRRDCEAKRDYLYNVLKTSGMEPVLSESGYFIMANWTRMNQDVTDKTDQHADYSFVKWLITNIKIFAYPMSRFYGSEDSNSYVEEDYIRFNMIKKWDSLHEVDKLINSRSQRQRLNADREALKPRWFV